MSCSLVWTEGMRKEPLSRQQQIKFMAEAKERRSKYIERWNTCVLLFQSLDDPCDDVVHWLPISESPKKPKETKDDN